MLQWVEAATSTMKTLFSKARATAANPFFLTSSTRWVVETTLAVVYNLYLSSQLMKLILTLLKVRKDILGPTFMPISANKKVFSKK